MKQAKKEIGAKMDKDNNEFFELLNKTTETFYKSIENSVVVEDSRNVTAGGPMSITDHMNETGYSVRFASDVPDIFKKPITTTAKRLSVLNQPAVPH